VFVKGKKQRKSKEKAMEKQRKNHLKHSASEAGSAFYGSL
jgi:hypothetical protein